MKEEASNHVVEKLRKIFVLGKFTNGHDAAIEFIKRNGWMIDECEIIFCGSHEQVLKCLVGNRSYAVLPIKNPTGGEVKDVVSRLRTFHEKGYRLDEIDRFDHQVKHCLVVRMSVADIGVIRTVKSHEQALKQCHRFLSAIEIQENKRISDGIHSTADAARMVAESEDSTVAAIASEHAATGFGLKILKKDIGPEGNKTTFILVENKAEVGCTKVGIIGIKGKSGAMLAEFYRSIGCVVFGSDLRDPDGMTNEEVVSQADVVVISVLPINSVPEVVQKLLPYIRSDQLLVDISSDKSVAINAMLEGKADVVGLHFMFRPGVPMMGQTIVYCPVRFGDSKWRLWVLNTLTLTGAKIVESTFEEHDLHMRPIQKGPHIQTLVSVLQLLHSELLPERVVDFTSPFYRLVYALMGRFLYGGGDVYASIIASGKETAAMLRERINIEEMLIGLIENEDVTGIAEIIHEAKAQFGDKSITDANELFERLLEVFGVLYGKSSLTLEFDKVDDEPGLLVRVLSVFSRHEVNLTSVHSFPANGKSIRFVIATPHERYSLPIQTVLEEIDSWPEHKLRVVESVW